jgi:hypothetical protein
VVEVNLNIPRSRKAHTWIRERQNTATSHHCT